MPNRPFEQPVPRAHLIWAAIDLDGTLAQSTWTADAPTSKIGEPIWPNVYKLRKLVAAGYKVVIHTARPSTDFEAIEAWLNHWLIPFSHIFTGKVLAAVYIDDKALNAESESWMPGESA